MFIHHIEVEVNRKKKKTEIFSNIRQLYTIVFLAHHLLFVQDSILQNFLFWIKRLIKLIILPPLGFVNIQIL